MMQLNVEEYGVRGNKLAPRRHWFCPNCYPRFKMRDPYWQALDRAEKMRLAEIQLREATKDREGKKRWGEEQERRRLANLKNKT